MTPPARSMASRPESRALDPRRVLERGYTITRTADGTIVRAAGVLSSGDVVVTETGDGKVQSRVEEIL